MRWGGGGAKWHGGGGIPLEFLPATPPTVDGHRAGRATVVRYTLSLYLFLFFPESLAFPRLES